MNTENPDTFTEVIPPITQAAPELAWSAAEDGDDTVQSWFGDDPETEPGSDEPDDEPEDHKWEVWRDAFVDAAPYLLGCAAVAFLATLIGLLIQNDAAAPIWSFICAVVSPAWVFLRDVVTFRVLGVLVVGSFAVVIVGKVLRR